MQGHKKRGKVQSLNQEVEGSNQIALNFFIRIPIR